MQTSMTGRPRPVTATVTKPKWMQIPNPDALRKIRTRSLESNGSTASLTSLLHHDSYDSASEDEEKYRETFEVKNTEEKLQDKESHHKKKPVKLESSREKPLRSKSESNLSAWEQWVIEKTIADQKKKLAEKQKKRHEKILKEEQEQQKREQLLKAEIKRRAWLEKKNQEELMQKKMEKLKIQENKRKKEEIDTQVKQKAAEKFAQWQEKKYKEEKEKKRKIKEENHKKKQLEEKRKQMAQVKFQEWLEKAKDRPSSAPNSIGYLSGKVTGYHDQNAYPQPSFYNPIAWQPPPIPPPRRTERKGKSKVKPYKWNPDKYL